MMGATPVESGKPANVPENGAHGCFYCRGIVESGSTFHDECADEYERRIDAERCVYCGRKAAISDLFEKVGEHMLCYRCDRNLVQRVYRGYPGKARG